MPTLVVTRAPRQRLCITLPDGREIWVAVVERRQNSLRIAVTADSDIVIDREEVKVERERAELQARLEHEQRGT